MKRGEEIKSVWPQESYTNILNHHIVRDIQSFKQSSATGELIFCQAVATISQLYENLLPANPFLVQVIFQFKKKKDQTFLSIHYWEKCTSYECLFLPPKKYIFPSSYNSILINLTASLLLKNKQCIYIRSDCPLLPFAEILCGCGFAWDRYKSC